MNKIVFESLNEVISFTRHNDPLSNLGVGQSHLITSWLDEMNIINYKLNSDLSIDVKGNVNISYKNLDKLPNYIKFNYVGGSFYCSDNNLTSLEGCPTSVDGNFSCSSNKLTSLEGCPTSVGGDFYCHNNNLTSLEGCPTSVGGNFYCDDNKVKFTEEYVRKLCDVKGAIAV